MLKHTTIQFLFIFETKEETKKSIVIIINELYFLSAEGIRHNMRH